MYDQECVDGYKDEEEVLNADFDDNCEGLVE